MLRVGVIGIGNMGSEHCRLIIGGATPEVELVACADLRKDRREWAKENLPKTVQVFDSGEKLIASGCCEAVLIAVPHPSHPALAVDALEHGMHVLCEKPIAVSTQEAKAMVEAAEKSGKVFALMFNQRTNGLYKRLKQLMDSGELGAI